MLINIHFYLKSDYVIYSYGSKIKITYKKIYIVNSSISTLLPICPLPTFISLSFQSFFMPIKIFCYFPSSSLVGVLGTGRFKVRGPGLSISHWLFQNDTVLRGHEIVRDLET